jgi:tetratricopeptide (TPR) repeat protein
VQAIGSLGNYYFGQYEGGQREVVGALRAEEANLLQARALARAHGWWHALMGPMQGLRVLYDHTGRRAERARLVEEVVPELVDPVTDGPLPGREGQWSLVSQYRVRLAREARRWTEAEKLQRITVEWDRQRASTALGLAAGRLSPGQRHAIRTLVASVHELGLIQRELGQPECVQSYKESYELALHIDDPASAATAAFNLGTGYEDLPAIRDLREAEGWYGRSLELRADEDRLGRARTLGQLGLVAYERFREGRGAARPEQELLAHLNTALRLYLEALDLIPQDAIADLAVTHIQLGNIYGDTGDLDRALEHCRRSISYSEAAGDVYGASQTRYNVAVTLAKAGRFADAKEYAAAALRGYQTFGDRAREEVMKTLELIALIDGGRKDSA